MPPGVGSDAEDNLDTDTHAVDGIVGSDAGAGHFVRFEEVTDADLESAIAETLARTEPGHSSDSDDGADDADGADGADGGQESESGEQEKEEHAVQKQAAAQGKLNPQELRTLRSAVGAQRQQYNQVRVAAQVK